MNPERSDRSPSIGFAIEANHTVVISGTNEEIVDWFEKLNKAHHKEMMNISLKETTMDKAKKNFAGKVSSSSFGKNVLKKMMDQTTREALKSVKKIIAIQSESKSLAEITERNLTKIAVKAYFLYEKGIISLKHLDNSETLSRKIIKQFYIIHVNINKISERNTKEEALQEKLTDIVELAAKLSKEIQGILEPHLTPKNFSKIDEVYKVVANIELLKGIFLNASLKPDLDQSMTVAANILGWEAAQCDNVCLLFDTKPNRW